MGSPDFTVYAIPIEKPSWEIRVLKSELEYGKHPFDFSCIYQQIARREIEVRLAQVGPHPRMLKKLLAKAQELEADWVRFTHNGVEKRFRTDRIR